MDPLGTLVSDQQLVMGQYQTITLPPDIQLTPGTVLTLHNGQVLRIEQGNGDTGISSDTITSDPLTTDTIKSDPTVSDSRRRPGRPKKQELKLEKPVGRGPFPCSVCREEFDSWAACRRHIRSHQLDKKLVCEECGASYNLEKNMRLHRATHQTGARLECPECNKTFSRLASLKCHLAMHEEDDNLTCLECGDEFTTEKMLEQHCEQKHSLVIPELKTESESSVKTEGFLTVFPGISSQEGSETKKSSFKCKTCGKTCENSREFKEHQLRHKKLKSSLELIRKRSKVLTREGFKLSCQYCSKKFLKPSQVIRHERIHTGVRPYKCAECGKAFTQKQSLESHSLKHTGQKPYACSFCSMKFSQRGNLRAHIGRVHNIEDDDKYKCSHCTCSFKKLGSLNAHISRFHPDEAEVAEDKMESGNEENNEDRRDSDVVPEEDDLLSKAINSTISDPLEDSKDCKKIVLTDRTAEGKVGRHSVRVRQREGTKYYICNFCPREFKKPSDLMRHTRIHTQDKPFKCGQCSRAFTVKSTLITHMKIHMNPSQREKPPCNKCGKVFYSHAAYKAHLKQHENPVPCDQCELTFISSGALKEHKHLVHKEYVRRQNPADYSDIKLGEPLIITNQGLVQNSPRFSSVYNPSDGELAERQYHCHYCSAVFKKSSHLKQHTRSHTGERPFVCYQCSKTFISRGSLNSHLRTHEGTRMYQCGDCQMMFTTAGSVRRHMAVHQDERPFMCPYCEKTFKTNVNCKKHMRTHIGSLTAQNPLGKFPPDVIVENPANLHSETVLTEGEPGNAGLVYVDQEAEVQGGQQTEAGSRMYTADDTGTITLDTVTDSSVLSLTAGELGLDMSQLTIQLEGVEQVNLASLPSRALRCGTCGLDCTTMEEMKKHLESHEIREEKREEMEPREEKTESAPESQNVAEVTVDPLAGLTGEVAGNPTFRRRAGGHIILSEEQTRALAETPIELAKTESEKMLLSSAAEKVKTEAETEKTKKKEVHPNQCNQCDFSFKKPSDLIRHMRTHTGERPYNCEICEKRFTVKSTLKTHMLVHTGSKTLVCHVCQSTFSSRTSLKVHMRLHTGSLPYKCDKCDERFRTPAHRKTHSQNVHSGGGASTREERKEVEEDKREVERKEEELVPLTISAESLAAALQHVSSSGAPLVGATVQLQLHGHGFESALTQLHIDEELLSQLRKGENININISKGQLNTESPPTTAKAATDILISQLGQQEMVMQETEKHTMIPLKQQDKEVEREVILSDNILLVPESDPATELLPNLVGEQSQTVELSVMEGMDMSQVYICPWCDSVFRSEKERKEHLLTLHGIEVKEDAGENKAASKEKSCHICDKKFVKPSQLVRHMRVHTGERPYACLMCRKSFNQKNALQMHMKKHTGERPHVCQFCQYAFSQKGNLKTHIQRSHSDRLLNTASLEGNQAILP